MRKAQDDLKLKNWLSSFISTCFTNPNARKRIYILHSYYNFFHGGFQTAFIAQCKRYTVNTNEEYVSRAGPRE